MTRADAVATVSALMVFAAVFGAAWLQAVTSALAGEWAWFWFDNLIAAVAIFGARECWRALDAGALALLPDDPPAGGADTLADEIIDGLGGMGR